MSIKRRFCDNAPLSAQQRNIWMEHEIYPENTSYNMVSCLRLSGCLNVEAFKKSLGEIVRRHEILRTTITVNESTPCLVVHPYMEAYVSETELAMFSLEEQEIKIKQAIHEESRLPFDLVQGPLFRFTLLLLNKNEYVFLMTIHHIVMDGWSIGLFANELTALYEAFCSGKPSPLPEVELQYSDYAIWQNDENKEFQARDASCWDDVIKDAVFGEIPTNYPRVFGKKGESAVQSVIIPAELTEKLKSFSRKEHVTPFITFLAGFQAVLHRYTDQENLLLGCYTAGRNQIEIKNLLGHYSNLIAVRTEFSGDPDFREILKRTRRSFFDSYTRGHLLVSNLSVSQGDEESVSSALFPVVFNFQNFQGRSWKLYDIDIKMEYTATDTTRFDMEISLFPIEKELMIIVQYRKDIYSEENIKRLLNHYKNILSSVIDNPDQPIQKLSMMNSDEMRQIVQDWNSEKAAYPIDATIHQLIEATAKENPDKIALTYKGQSVSYRELINRSNYIARELIEMGVGPEVMVGVNMERSDNLIITLLAILKAGGVYVPLDPIYPDEKLTFMLLDSGAPILLVDKSQIAKFHDYTGKIIEVESLLSQYSEETVYGFPLVNISSENSAYLIYTSGSTGKPKGVLVTHRNVVNFFCFMNSYIDDTNTSRTWLFSTSISFDPSVLEMFWTLSRGYQVIVLPNESSGKFLDIDAIPELIQKHHVSHFQGTPSVLSMLVDRVDGLAALKRLSKLMVGGESLPFNLAKKLSSELDIDIYNVYGPTEATIWATYYRLSKDDTCVPIGRPLPNYSIYILNNNLQPVPIGAYGELYIGGDGVAREYFKDPELTARKYLPDPFSRRQDDRMYRTGDVARYDANGVIEFRGRADRQVKVRGHRIELGEIEAAIMDCGGVREAIVITSGNTDIDRKILGYVIPDFASADAEELNSYKEERLNGWQELWDQTYRDADTIRETEFNTVGWNSIFTNEPIPPDEMREWVEATVGRILSLHPRRVLEIGCGTGLLLFRIAQDCERYYATDVSAYVVESLNRQATERKLNQVSLSHRTAHDFSGFDAQSFDTIILNSVIQYFPSVSYLRDVLENAIRLLSPGGSIFLGDIRNFDLLGCMYTAGGIARATNQLSLRELRNKVKHTIDNERELAISPVWFRVLSQQSANIGEIDIQLKRGKITNEINKFRYDVTLHLDRKRAVVPEKRLEWFKDAHSIHDILCHAIQYPDELLKVTNIPNPQLSKEKAQWLKLNDPQTRNIRELNAPSGLEDGVTLEDFWKIEDKLQRPVIIGYGKDDPFTIQISLFPKNNEWISQSVVRSEFHPGNYDHMANDPLWPVRIHKLSRNLKEELIKKLPDFMIPASLVVLKEFPKLSNGKIDRKSLPLPDTSTVDVAKSKDVLSSMESTLMEIWEDVLGIDGFSTEDNYMDIGGNSLSAIMIINRIKSIINTKITIKDFLDNPTVKLLAKLIEQRAENTTDEKLDRIPSIDRNDDMPLSFFQEGRLRGEFNSDVRNTSYMHVSSWFNLRLSGNLDREVLEKSFNYVINRHEVFRTAYWPIFGTVSPSINKWDVVCQSCRMNPGQFLPKVKFKQSINPSVVMNFDYYDVSKYSDEDKDIEIYVIADDIIQKRYMYESPPLTRAALIQTAESEHILIVTASHLIADAFSMRIYEKELAHVYSAFINKKSIILPDIKLQYADYAAWMKHRLEVGSLDSIKSYWLKQFDGYTPTDVTILPFAEVEDCKNDADFNLEAKYYYHPISDELSVAIRKYAGSVNMTTFSITMTGFILALCEESGKDDIGVFTFFANRVRPETENIIGMFATGNTVRVKVNQDDSLYQCAVAVSDSLNGALKNQELMVFPSDSRVNKSLCDIVVNRPITCELLIDDDCASFSGLDVEKAVIGRSKSEYALRSFVVDSKGKLSLLFQYNLDLFDGSDIRRMAARTESIIKEMVTNPFSIISAVLLKK